MSTIPLISKKTLFLALVKKKMQNFTINMKTYSRYLKSVNRALNVVVLKKNELFQIFSLTLNLLSIYSQCVE